MQFFTLQAQDGEMDIGTSKDVHIYSLQTLLMQAKKLALRIDGAEITMKNGEITLSATKPVKVKGAGFVFERSSNRTAETLRTVKYEYTSPPKSNATSDA